MLAANGASLPPRWVIQIRIIRQLIEARGVFTRAVRARARSFMVTQAMVSAEVSAETKATAHHTGDAVGLTRRWLTRG